MMAVLEYQTSDHPGTVAPLSLGIVPCAVGLAGNVCGILASFVTVYDLPAGTKIRPAGLLMLWAVIAFATAAAGMSYGIVGISRGRRRVACWLLAAVGMLLSLTPLFTSRWVLLWIGANHGLRLAG